MSDPEFLLCVVCETPTYDLDFQNDKLVAALCATCGNDDVDQFLTEADFEEL